MPTIGIWVSEEEKRKYEILNKHPKRLGTKALKDALEKAFEEYAWWFELYEELENKLELESQNEEDTEAIMKITQEEILSEI